MTYQEKLAAFFKGFDKTVISMVAKPGEQRDIEFNYDGEIPLMGAEQGCSCQNFICKDGKISGTWTVGTMEGPDSTYLVAYADDGEPIQIVDQHGMIIQNPGKVKVTLTLQADVQEA